MLKNLALFHALHTKMDWLATRNQLISSNIANANTPDYVPMDVEETDFSKVIERSHRQSAASNVGVHNTNSQHIHSNTRLGNPIGGENAKSTYEVSPDGNAVILEEQMLKSNRISGEYQMASNLYARYLGMINTAAGRGGAQ